MHPHADGTDRRKPRDAGDTRRPPDADKIALIQGGFPFAYGRYAVPVLPVFGRSRATVPTKVCAY